MAFIRNVLSAVTDFLNEAQSLGIIKEFNLVQCEHMKENSFSEANELFSKFLNKVHSVSVEDNKCPITENVEVTKEEEKSEDNSIVESSGEKDLVQMQVDTNEVSTESSSSSITEHIEIITDQEKKTENVNASNSSVKENLIQDTVKETSKVEGVLNKNLVQIQVDTNEMKRRISAFISRKRKEVDEWNVQEFCGRSYYDEQDPAWEQSESCARVDAVFVPRRGSNSHIKVSKVRNVWGPQTQSQAKKIKQEPGQVENHPNDASLQAIEERLLSMESHLKLQSDSALRSNIFQRLKDLENRILLLESTSPEYIHLHNSDYSSPKKKCNFEKEKIYLNYGTDELKKRIQNLKETCKVKLPQIKTEPIC